MVLFSRIFLKGFWTLPNYLCCRKHCEHGHGWARNVKTCTLQAICTNQLQLQYFYDPHMTTEFPATIIVRMLGVLGSMAAFSTLAHQWAMAVFPSSRWVHRWREVERTGCQKPASGRSFFGVFQRMIGNAGLTMEVTDVRWCEWYIGCCNQSLSSRSLTLILCFSGGTSSMENLKGRLWSCGQMWSTTWKNQHIYFSTSADRSNGMSSNAKGCWLKLCWMQRSFRESKLFPMLMKY